MARGGDRRTGEEPRDSAAAHEHASRTSNRREGAANEAHPDRCCRVDVRAQHGLSGLSGWRNVGPQSFHQAELGHRIPDLDWVRGGDSGRVGGLCGG